MKSRELMAACLNPGADTYMYRRVLRELAAKTDYATCIIQSGRTYYEWNRNLRPTLYDLTLRLEGGMHEVRFTLFHLPADSSQFVRTAFPGVFHLVDKGGCFGHGRAVCPYLIHRVGNALYGDVVFCQILLQGYGLCGGKYLSVYTYN